MLLARILIEEFEGKVCANMCYSSVDIKSDAMCNRCENRCSALGWRHEKVPWRSYANFMEDGMTRCFGRNSWTKS